MSYNYSSRPYAAGYGNGTPLFEVKGKEKDQPLDTVSSIVWDPFNQDPIFAASSWDGFVRLYMVTTSSSTQEVTKVCEFFLHHPVLCVDFSNNGMLFAGLASGDVVVIEIQSGNYMPLGTHDAPICGVYWLSQYSIVMTLGFDNLIKFWRVQPENAFQTQLELPLKTVTCSLDFPLLLIGSIETTVGIISLKNLPNVSIPKAEDYQKSTLERFSKFCSSRILCANNSGLMGTIDGRSLAFTFKEGYNGKFELITPYVVRVQKSTIRATTHFGQVDCVDIGYHNYEIFTIVGGSEEMVIFNTNKKSKAKTLTIANTTTGAATAVRISPRNEYIAFATGCDWLKGLYELETIKKPRITVGKLSSNDLNECTSK